MARWAQSLPSRGQIVLFSPTLEDTVSHDHPVRLFDEVLGRVIDHTRLCIFRTRFEKHFKALFRQVGRVAIGMGMANLNQVALDGTIRRAKSQGADRCRGHAVDARQVERR